MKSKRFLPRVLKGIAGISVCCFTLTSNAQTSQPTIFEDWNNSAGTQYFFQKSVTKTDASSNVFIAGATMNSSGNYDALVAKYSSTGALIWINQYAGSGNQDDFASALFLDGGGNVYITGAVTNTVGDSSNVLTVKYNSSGTQQWASTYHGGTGSDYGTALMADASGNVYVTGTSNRGSTNKFDVVGLKYNSSGTQQWVSFYNYNNLNDGGYKIVFSGSKVAVGAGVQNNSTDYKMAALIFHPTTGVPSLMSVSSSAGIGFAMVHGMTTDANKNVYITGSKSNTGVGLDYYTVKYDSNLVSQWTATYNGSASLNDEAKGIAVDASGNVYVTGYATLSGQSTDYATIKYNSSGTQQWVQTVNGTNNGHDEATAIALDASGLPVVTGWKHNGVNNDYYTIKYDASGTTLWSASWHSVGDKDDRAFDVAAAQDGSFIVVGQTGVPGALSYTAVRYIQKIAIYMPDGMALSTAWAFVKNRGQLLGTDGNKHDTIKYYNAETWPRTYFSNKTTSYVFLNRRDSLNLVDSMARIDMTPKNANPDRVIRAYDPRTDHHNYYGGGTPQGAVRVPLYRRLTTYDLYTKIDMMQTHNGTGPVTYFAVKPTGNPANIEMNWSGQTSMSINGGGDLVLTTGCGSMTIQKADVFQVDASGNYVSLAWSPAYSISGNTVSFTSLGSYNSSYTLVFRMYQGPYTAPSSPANGNMWWSTHYGTVNDNDYGMDVCNDNVGNAYVGGYTWDQSFPLWNTATTWNGGMTEGVVLKFNADARREWVLFYGGGGPSGSGFDWVRSVTFNGGVSSNHLYIAGQTNSRAGTFPIAPSANPSNGSYWQDTNYVYNTVSYDAFIARMDTAFGAISWSTFFGGRDQDEGRVVRCAPNGRVYLAGNTRSSLNDTTGSTAPANHYFPLCHSVLSSYFDYTFGGGMQDCFIAAFDTTNTLRWSTYLGGGGLDEMYDATYDTVQNAFFAVGATDGSFPLMWSGSDYHIGAYAVMNTQKGFVSRFANSGAMQWCTAVNRVSSIQTVTSIGGQVMIAGVTNIPTDPGIITQQDTSGGYAIWGPSGGHIDQTINGQADYYIMAFGPPNMLRWATFYGGGSDESATFAFQINYEKKFLDAVHDDSGNVYLTGITDNTGSAFPTVNQPPFFWQSAYAGGEPTSADVNMFCFRANKSLAWSTYCGGDCPWTGFPYIDCASDVASQISWSPAQQRLYFTGFTGSNNYPFICPSTANPWCYTPVVWNTDAPWDIYLTSLDLQGLNVGIPDSIKEQPGVLTVFPSPTADEFTVLLPGDGTEKSSILVYNALGQIVATQTINPGQNRTTFNTTTWANGVYSIQYIDHENMYSQKVVIQH